MTPMEFATPQEAATYAMLQHVLHNHLATAGLSYEEALNVTLELFCTLCALFYVDICHVPGRVHDAEGRSVDIPGLVRQQIGWLKRACHSRQQQPASLRGSLYEPAPSQGYTPAPAALRYTQALQGLLRDASDAHQLHRVACLRIVRTLLADILASILFTTLGYTGEAADQVVEEHIAPVLMTYLSSHGPRLARAREQEPSD